MSVNVAFVPYALEWWVGSPERAEFAERLISQLARYCTNLESIVVASELLTPADIEATHGAVQGHWHHGEMTIHQSFMMRPLYGAAQYDTPVDGLFLCGAGCHPGRRPDRAARPQRGANACSRLRRFGMSTSATSTSGRPYSTRRFMCAFAALSTTEEWTTWNTYQAPRVVDKLSTEYFAVRSGCAVMDLTPMEKYRISGRDARAYLDRLVDPGHLETAARTRYLRRLVQRRRQTHR